jgi:hypothetical protein
MKSRLVWTAILIAAGLAPVQAQVPTGHLKGRVGSVATGERLAGVTVTVGGTKLGAMTDGEGAFAIAAIPVGGYNVTFRCLGYQSQTVTDVMIRSDRVSYLNADLPEIAVELDTLQVVSAYFQKEPDAPLSNTRFRAEEIRRAPGSAGDISRVLTALPAAAQVADNANDLMIRGGSPAENLFLVDNIPIPNINHFPVQGATGGPIGILNVDFIEDVRVSTGGFPAGFGDRLSSVIDIRLREGNREKTETQVDMNMAGFGTAAEGPLARGKGSWMVSAKRSYLDLFVGAIGTGVAPRFGDVQGKLTYDLSPRNRLTVVDVFGASAIRFSHDQAFRTGQFLYGRYAGRQNTLGVNWRSLWSRNGYSNTSLSYAFLHSNDAWQEVRNDREYYRAENGEGTLTLRNANYYEFSRHHKLEFGLEVWRRAADYR